MITRIPPMTRTTLDPEEKDAAPGGAGAKFVPATTLEDAEDAATVEPLPDDDPRYTDLRAARGDDDALKWLTRKVKRAIAKGRNANLVLTGHKGVGKSTELLRFERAMLTEGVAYPVHLVIDQTLLEEGDVSLVILWLAHRLAFEMAKRGMPIEDRYVEEVASWFDEKVKVGIETKQVDESARLSTEAKAGLTGFGFGVKALARLTAAMKSSDQQRQEAKRELQSYAQDLLGTFNNLLDAARDAIAAHGDVPRELLIVIDDLDKFRNPDVAQSFFFGSGTLLRDLEVHCVMTAPIDIVLSPRRLSMAFTEQRTLKTPNPRKRDGSPNNAAIEGLRDLIAHRISVEDVFETRDALDRLICASGGSLRELMRLIGYAVDDAFDRDGTKIGPADADGAVDRVRLEFERVLIPWTVYMPYLAGLHHYRAPAEELGETDGRNRLSDLLLNGAVMEYNGGATWYDVHPAITEADIFREALARIDHGDSG
ncbi:MAG: hypothetical protein RID91_04615 [Azospirillaceae bacterium]